jgi:chitin synthase
VGNLSLCESPEATPINSYVKLLVQNVEEAAWEVYKTKIQISKPTKIVTPYGGRLIWTLPGRTKMIAHLKDKNKIRHKKRWSQVMYMYYFLGYRIMQLDASPERKRIIAQNTYLLALDGDIDFQPNAVHLLIDRMKNDPDLGAACGRIHPVGKGPMVWYQKFEYAIGHWLQKATEHVIGCVLCSPGCFSLFRGRALMENSVMKKYTTKSDQARHYIQYDQGEDRWLCTLILKQKYRVEYCAASDAYTHAPEGFNEFYNQRRRWVPSTIANIFDLLGDAGKISKVNSNISRPYIFYQVILMFGTIIGPGTIFLMMVSAIQSVFLIDIYLAFLYNFVPLMIFMLVCYICKQKIQLLAAFIISVIYSLIMMAVMVGITIQVIEDGILAPSSLFFFTVTLQIIITGILHPQEVGCLPAGFVYYVTIPCMYMLLTIYSLFNMNDVSWGTRENPQEAGPSKVEKVVKPKNRFQKILGYFRTQIDDEEEGSLDFSFAGLFRCMFCTHKKDNTINSQLYEVNESLNELSSRMKSLEHKLVAENTKMHLEEDFNDDSDDFEDIPLVTKEESKSNLLPDWLYDPDLKDGDTETISANEEQFWVDLIEKYLTPIDMTTKYKEKMANQLKAYRDISTFAFVMCNALFVLIVFLLQLNKQYLRMRWPFNVLNDINFDQATFEFTIRREYTYLEPISMLFVLFFGLVLVVQFIAMLFHRFATISQILATTKIDWYCSKKVKDTLSSSELKENAVNIAKLLQKPRPDWEFDDDERGNPIQRDTIHQLLLQQKKQKDWSNLETNFKRELFSEGEIKLLKKLKLSRKTVGILDEMRKWTAEYQKSKTSAIYMKNPYLMSNESLYSLALSMNSEKDSFTIYQRASYRKSRPSSPVPSVVYSSAQMPLKSALKKSKTAPSLHDENIYERGELNLSFVNDENEQEFVHDDGKGHNSVSFGDFSASDSDDDHPIEIKINDRV